MGSLPFTSRRHRLSSLLKRQRSGAQAGGCQTVAEQVAPDPATTTNWNCKQPWVTAKDLLDFVQIPIELGRDAAQIRPQQNLLSKGVSRVEGDTQSTGTSSWLMQHPTWWSKSCEGCRSTNMMLYHALHYLNETKFETRYRSRKDINRKRSNVTCNADSGKFDSELPPLSGHVAALERSCLHANSENSSLESPPAEEDVLCTVQPDLIGCIHRISDWSAPSLVRRSRIGL